MEWQEIALIVLVVVLLVAGGYIKRLTKEVKELVDCFSTAIEDKKITREELRKIVKEARDVEAVARQIIVEISHLLLRKHKG